MDSILWGIVIIGFFYCLIKWVVSFFLNKTWDSNWQKLLKNKEIFKTFYQIKFNDNKKVYESDIEIIREKWRGDPELFKLFEIYLLHDQKENLRKNRLKKELDRLYNRISDDYSNNRVKGKIHTKKLPNGNNSVTYYFENGDYVWMRNNTLGYSTNHTTIEYGLNGNLEKKFKNSFNKIIRDSNLYASQRKGVKNFKNSKKNLYNTLVDNVIKREENLKKINKSDSNWVSLNNELQSVKRKRDNIKNKYNF